MRSSFRLTPERASAVKCPVIKESPINIECEVKDIIKFGSHDMFIAKIVAVLADEKYMDNTGRFNFEKSRPLCYSHGEYYGLGKYLGKFGHSVKKNRNK